MITRSHAMRAARAKKRTSEWARHNAALFADNLETQLARSLHLIKQEDGAPLMYISPADLLALEENFCTCDEDSMCPPCYAAGNKRH